ncbi:MAG: acyl-CoA thioesterase [Pseudomonadota bacterium]
MYPAIRMALALWSGSRQPERDVNDTFESTHRVMPWDIDIFGELNNGTTLTLLDLNRLPFGGRVNWNQTLIKNGWMMTMAGVSVRYRRRIRAFQKIRITCKAVGRDDRFFYLVQTIYRGDEPTTQALYRVAVTNKKGMIPTQEMVEAMDELDWNPEIPDWVAAWIAAEDLRPWPPET